jgi:RNA polymerase sigma-70 factor (ECF subfamily)
MGVETPTAIFFPVFLPYAVGAVDLPELLQKAAARDERAWGILVDRYGPLVWRILRRFANLTAEEREDLSQKVFLILMNRALQQFRGSTEHEFRAYLKRITENEAKKHILSRPPVGPFTNDEGDEEPADPTPGPEELFAAQEVRQQILGCLAQIPHTDQEVFWLSLREIPIKEISEILEVPQGTVASKYHRAKERIVACLRRAGVLL